MPSSGSERPDAHCIATDVILTAENDSDAHVIPNAIGGRLKPTGVLSRIANSEIGDHIEAPFLKNYQQIIALIGGKRQRGDHPSYRVEAPDGRVYLIRPDGSLTPNRPEYRATTTKEGEQIEVVARTMTEMRTLLGQVKKRYPHFNIEEALHQAVEVSQPSPKVKISLSVGPNVYFPLAYAAAATFNASRGLPVHPEFKAYYDLLDADPVSLPPDTFYWEPEQQWVELPNAATHLITTIISARLAKAITVVRLVGLPGVAVVTDYNGDRSRSVTYGVDVVEGADVSLLVDASAVARMPWQPTHRLGETSLFELQTRRMNEVAKLAQDLGYIR